MGAGSLPQSVFACMYDESFLRYVLPLSNVATNKLTSNTEKVEGSYICSSENCSFVVPVRSLLLSRQTSDWNYKAKTFVGTNVKPLYYTLCSHLTWS